MDTPKIIDCNYSILTCQQRVVGAKGKVGAEYTLGGVPTVLIPSDKLSGSGLCGTKKASISSSGTAGPQTSRAFQHLSSWHAVAPLVLCGLLSVLLAITSY